MKIDAPWADRNQELVFQVLRQVLPEAGTVLEIASGSGQNAVHAARGLPNLVWQPTDIDPKALESIRAWIDESALHNIKPPLVLDVCSETWPVPSVAAVMNMNMIHITGWAVCEALFAGASRVLASGNPLYLYGPFFSQEQEPAQSNLEFDRWLRDQNPRWGVRTLSDVDAVASNVGMVRTDLIDMPASNLSVVYRKI